MDATRPAAEPRSASSGMGEAATRVLALLREHAIARWELWPLLGLGLVSALIYLQSAPVVGLPFDDSYISLLFARNLAEHGFLTFDGETASAGATSVLHVAILAVPIKLGADPVKASLGLGVLLQLGLVAAVYWLSWSIFRHRVAATLAGLSVAAVGYLVMDALNGMETTLFMLVTAATTAAYFTAKGGAPSETRFLALAGVLGALGVLTRPEGVLLIGAVLLYDVVMAEDERPIRSLAEARRLALLGGPSAVALAVLASYYWATTGSLTPGTATAKYLFFREFEYSLIDKSRLLQSGLAAFAAPLWPWLALAAFAALRKETLLFGAFWLAFMLLYFFLFPGGIEHYWYRYQHVFLPPLIVYAAAGSAFLVRGRTFSARQAAAAGAVGAVLFGFIALQYESFRNFYVGEIKVNEERQVATAKLLNRLVPPGQSIATHDIGAIGYFTQRPVFDLVGLVNPDVVDYHEGRRLREYVDQVRPNYLVVFESWERDYLHLGLKDDPELFELVVPHGGTGKFLVYRTHYTRASSH